MRGSDPAVVVELRPPRAGLGAEAGMDAWIDLNHAVRRFTAQGRLVLLTDDAVGQAEEESLGHLAANLDPGTERWRVVPFLTCKHTLDYCLLYGERALAMGLAGLTVVGGDPTVGEPRCVPHAWELRKRLRERVPGLELGGWANPFRDPGEQAGFLADPDAHADYVLTQVVSHHDAGRLAALLDAVRERDAARPTLAGIFHYRSSNPDTLARLGAYFPVPASRLAAEFDAGASPVEITARSIRAALDAGADGVYVSNLGLRTAARTLAEVLERAGIPSSPGPA